MNLGRAFILHGDARTLPLPDASIDAVVCDPPYGLEFMGREWDSFKPSSARIRTRVDARTNPAEGKSTTSTPEAYVAGAPFQAWSEEWAREALRVLKPGGHLLAFGGTRTWHRLTCAVEDAGFEIRDSIAWMYGSGFPKSLDVSKAIDKQRDDQADVDRVRAWLNDRRLAVGLSHDAINRHFGHATNGGGSSSSWMTNPTSRSLPTWEQWIKLRELLSFGDEMDAEVWRLNGRKGQPGEAWDQREVIETREVQDIRNGHGRAYGGAMFAGEETGKIEHRVTAPATPEAARWQGWGTALKPGHEPIVLARKPLAGTVAGNVLAYGTGALNVDGCRVPADDKAKFPAGYSKATGTVFAQDEYSKNWASGEDANPAGRFPPNVVLTHSPLVDEHGEPVGDACADGCVPGCPVAELDAQSGTSKDGVAVNRNRSGIKPASTYGTYGVPAPNDVGYGGQGGAARFFPAFRYEAKAASHERPVVNGVAHPTVKPVALMRWLVRLVTPPGGLILDPFAGSGTTLEAAIREGVNAVGVELGAEHIPLIRRRIDRARCLDITAPRPPKVRHVDGQDSLFGEDGAA